PRSPGRPGRRCWPTGCAPCRAAAPPTRPRPRTRPHPRARIRPHRRPRPRPPRSPPDDLRLPAAVRREHGPRRRLVLLPLPETLVGRRRHGAGGAGLRRGIDLEDPDRLTPSAPEAPRVRHPSAAAPRPDPVRPQTPGSPIRAGDLGPTPGIDPDPPR